MGGRPPGAYALPGRSFALPELDADAELRNPFNGLLASVRVAKLQKRVAQLEDAVQHLERVADATYHRTRYLELLAGVDIPCDIVVVPEDAPLDVLAKMIRGRRR